ncbi:MAG TPA: excinuclease ABC subunit UvrC [Clostridiales bacterium]|nr:excinuclease ABC subunit UvrC [Clostridiales bacterium]
MKNLEQKLKLLPEKPGVYIMYDSDMQILYIGKAKVLKNRVRQYFHQSGNQTEKVMNMVAKIADFSYIIASSELDALALEANLIKKHKPPYNILLKDDKSRPYIRIDTRQKYPSLEITRRLKPDGAKYFGPYFGVAIREMVELISGAYLVRACNYKRFNRSHRECLNYHIGLCSAPCVGRVSPEEYRRQIDKVIAFLSGKDNHMEEILRDRMTQAANEQKFEAAISYRDKLEMLERMKQRIITSLPKTTNLDIFGFASNPSLSVISALIVRAGKMSGAENFPVIDVTLSPNEMLSSFLVQYYNGTRNPAEEIIVPCLPDDHEGLKEWIFSKHKKTVQFLAPKQGVRKQLLDNAFINADDYLKNYAGREKIKRDMAKGAVDNLQQILGLKRKPHIMECYDVSNISGTDKVASMVVFVGGEPDKSRYRRFRIKTVEGADDYKSIHEVITRRLERLKNNDERFGAMPDLIVIDGGKGQLSVANDAMKRAGFDIELIGLAEKEEDIYLVGRSEPVKLDKSSWELKLLQRIRDEAHRFALGYHKSLREKHIVSELVNIQGIGKKLAQNLYKSFLSIENIKKADIQSLKQVKGISDSTAKKIYDYFHG